jgi:hypothetical protein
LNALCGCWPTTLFIIKDDVVGRSGGDAVSRPPDMSIDLRQSANFFVALLSNLARIISFYLFVERKNSGRAHQPENLDCEGDDEILF